MTTTERIHEIVFQPKDLTPECAVVGLSLPDCVANYQLFRHGVRDAVENWTNRKALESGSSPRNAEHWIRSVCVIANHNLAYVCFTCSTPEHAEMAATLASSLLPNHERIFPVSLNRPTKDSASVMTLRKGTCRGAGALASATRPRGRAE